MDFSAPTEPVNFSLARPLDYGVTPDYSRAPTAPACTPHDNGYAAAPDRTHDFRNMNGKQDDSHLSLCSGSGVGVSNITINELL